MQNPKLHVKSGSLEGQVLEIVKTETLLGRAEPADIVFDSSTVSSEHARIVRKGDDYFIEDLDSSNGTRVNGHLLVTPHKLSHGDSIQLGLDVSLIYEAERADQTVGPAAVDGKPEQTARPGMLSGTMVVDFANLAPSSQRNVEQARETMLDTGDAAAQGGGAGEPPSLLISIAGEGEKSHVLRDERITIGRADDNTIVVDSRVVSRHHLVIEKTPEGHQLIILPGVTNSVSCNGKIIVQRKVLLHNDVLRVDSNVPGLMVTMTFRDPSQIGAQAPLDIRFGEKDVLTFGRDASCDITLNMPTVSRYHAEVTRVGRRYFINDLRSSNGTFVNDVRVEGNVWLEQGDVIRIGPYRFVMGKDAFTAFESTDGLQVEVYNLEKWVRKDLNLLQDISLIIQPREFIVVVGQSGGGKSTMVDAIAGYRPATDGKVFVNNIDVYKNFDAVRSEIGFVPQKDIIHMELTVYQALDYAAQLRMPTDTTKEERHERIMEVLDDLDLTHRKDVQISGLSGGQQKRVSIGVELLTRPGLFFLDEPTSGLDPGTETTFMHLMRRLADQGRTIMMVTHATKNVMLADKVVFLARGGYVAWYGPPNEALEYFDQFRSEHQKRARRMEFDQIYAILDDPSLGDGEKWAGRYREYKAHRKYIEEPLEACRRDKAELEEASGEKKKSKGARVPGWKQFLVLSKRNIRILTRDRSSMVLMLLAPPAVAALDLVLAPLVGSAPFAFNGGDAINGSVTLFILTMYTLLVGGMSQMREFVKETEIYKRERLVNLKILPYVTSKVWVALLLSFYHALAYTVMHAIAFDMPGGFDVLLQVYVTLTLATMAGMMLGLLASAISPNAGAAPLTLILFIIPLIVLSGSLAPVPPQINQFASTRWTFQGLMGIMGSGSDIAADPCWALDEDLRQGMTLEDKDAFGCRCMGTNLFSSGSCSFPGAGDFYVEAIDLEPPVEPAGLPPKPQEPEVPEAPEQPEDSFDQVAMAQYMNELGAYQETVRDIQDDYRNQMFLYEATVDVYQNEMIDYQEDLALYNIARVSAVKGAESVMDTITDKYGWTYVNKEDPAVYRRWLGQSWLAHLAIVGAYYLVILGLVKRKDVR